MTENIIKTDWHREITVQEGWLGEESKHIGIRNTADATEHVSALLSGENAKEIAGALLGNNVAVITDLPEAKRDGYGYVESGNHAKHEDSDPDTLEASAKKMLAIAKFIRKANAEKGAAAEAQKAKEAKEAEAAIAELEAVAKLTKRRDELASEFRGYESFYADSSHVFKKSIDRIIELEDAAAKPRPMFSL